MMICSTLWLLSCTEGRRFHLVGDPDPDREDDDDDLQAADDEPIRAGIRELSQASSFNQSMYISRYIVVDKNGGGHYTSVQEAVDAVPDYNSKWVFIQINAGLYK
jgi:hypothetical protein